MVSTFHSREPFVTRLQWSVLIDHDQLLWKRNGESSHLASDDKTWQNKRINKLEHKHKMNITTINLCATHSITTCVAHCLSLLIPLPLCHVIISRKYTTHSPIQSMSCLYSSYSLLSLTGGGGAGRWGLCWLNLLRNMFRGNLLKYINKQKTNKLWVLLTRL